MPMRALTAFSQMKEDWQTDLHFSICACQLQLMYCAHQAWYRDKNTSQLKIQVFGSNSNEFVNYGFSHIWSEGRGYGRGRRGVKTSTINKLFFLNEKKAAQKQRIRCQKKTKVRKKDCVRSCLS